MSSYGGHASSTLVDILDRVLDKGLVVAGDIRVSLANVELLTIRIRLLVCSIDKAEQIGLNWCRYDENLGHPAGPAGGTLPTAADGATIARLEARISELESQLQIQAPIQTSRTPRAPRASRARQARQEPTQVTQAAAQAALAAQAPPAAKSSARRRNTSR